MRLPNLVDDRRRPGDRRRADRRCRVLPLGRAVRAGGGAQRVGAAAARTTRIWKSTWSRRCRWSTTATRRPSRATTSRSLALIEEHLLPLHEAGVIPLCIGGDHSIALAELRAAARVHGPLALVHLDAHADVWEDYYGARYFHGTVFKRAVEEGLVDPSRSVQAGMRGTLYGASDVHASAELGYDALTWSELERADAGGVRRPRAGAGGRRARVPELRHRLRRPRVRARHGHAGGRRADEQPGARVPARADRDRLPRASTAWRSRPPTTRRRSRRGWRRAPATR